jgi:hypothetical protein
MKKLLLFVLNILLLGPVFAQWQQTNGPLGGSNSSLTIDATTGYLYGDSEAGGVFLFKNDGISWSTISNGFSSTFVSALSITGTDIYAGIMHGGVRKAALADFNITTSAEKLSNSDLVIYPAIVRDMMKISCPDSYPGTSISIYDLFGKEVCNVKNANAITEIDMTGFTSVVYIVKIAFKGKIGLTRKVIKL